jgi:hypothetical protein
MKMNNLNCYNTGYVFQDQDEKCFITDIFVDENKNYFHNELKEISYDQYMSAKKFNKKRILVMFPIEAANKF